MKSRSRLFSGFLLLILLFAPTRAHAYIDPGTGSLLWQLVFAAGVGGLFYLRKAVAWVGRLRGRKANAAQHLVSTPELKSEKEAEDLSPRSPQDR